MGRLKKDIVKFVAKCINCQHVRAEHQNPDGLLHEIQVPTLNWGDNKIYFLLGLPRTQKHHDSLWVGLDRLTKSTHIIPIKSTYSAEDYPRILIDEIVCHHGIQLSIILYKGAQFTSRFWRSIQERLGTKVMLNNTFHL